MIEQHEADGSQSDQLRDRSPRTENEGAMSDNITYNHGAVSDFAADVGSRSAQLMEIHDDIHQRTTAIADYFSGAAATSFPWGANADAPRA